MPIGTLLDGDVERYFDEERDVRGALWFFIHVPKTAGSSFRQEIAQRLYPNANVFVERFDSAGSYDRQLREAMRRFVRQLPRRKHRFASGHVLRPMTRALRRARRRLRLVTMLRNPVSRVISDFRYQCTPAHPPFREFIKAFPTLESYIETEGARNKIYKHLAADPSAPADDVIRELESSMAFVGVQEMYYLSCRIQLALLGYPGDAPTVYERKTEAVPENRVKVTDALRSRIRDLNELDSAIYGHFVRRLKAVREKILETLKA